MSGLQGKQITGYATHADHIIITDIYSARELDDGKVHAKDLVEKLTQNGYDAQYISDFEEISSYLIQNAQADDLVMMMGDGDIYRVGELMLKKIESDQKVSAMA